VSVVADELPEAEEQAADPAAFISDEPPIQEVSVVADELPETEEVSEPLSATPSSDTLSEDELAAAIAAMQADMGGDEQNGVNADDPSLYGSFAQLADAPAAPAVNPVDTVIPPKPSMPHATILRYKRVQLNAPIDLRFSVAPYTDRTAPPIRGLMTEIGPSGLHVLLGTPYYSNTRFEISFELEGLLLQFCATVKKVKWFSNAPGMTYKHSMQITRMDQTDFMRLVTYLTQMLGGDPGSVVQRAA
jgi:hypothetical protein